MANIPNADSQSSQKHAESPLDLAPPPQWTVLDTNPDNRRYAELAWLLRARTLVDVDCWSRVPGVPLAPGQIEREIRRRLTGEDAARSSAPQTVGLSEASTAEGQPCTD